MVSLVGRDLAGGVGETEFGQAWWTRCEAARPPELRATAGTLGLAADAIEPTLDALLGQLERWIGAPPEPELLDAVRATRCVGGRCAGRGGADIDEAGRLDGGRVALDAGEVHLQPGGAAA